MTLARAKCAVNAVFTHSAVQRVYHPNHPNHPNERVTAVRRVRGRRMCAATHLSYLVVERELRDLGR
jgi:hypothetical protein